MSLSTRIAIGPSRSLAFAEGTMIAGAIAVTAATAVARPLADAAPEVWWLGLGTAVLVAVAVGAKRWIKRSRACVYEIIISDRAGIAARRLDEDTVPQHFELTDASMVWPRFAVLSLSSGPVAGPRAGPRRRVLDIPVLRGEMKGGDARRLHRFMLWTQRGGPHVIGSTGEDAVG